MSVHDFPDEELGKVTPYGIYDLTANTGWVNVGSDHDTGASPSPRSAPGGTDPAGPPTPAPGACWSPPTPAGPTARVCGVEDRAGRVAAEAGLDITVLHLPPGTSKWNKIEHRLFPRSP